MKMAISQFFLGVLAGATSWGVVGLISDHYEPFDNSAGFYLGQSILSALALFIGHKGKFKALIIYLIGAYLGMNAYANFLGSPGQRGWWVLGMITTLSLIVLPLIFGLIGYVVNNIQQKYNKSVHGTSTSGRRP